MQEKREGGEREHVYILGKIQSELKLFLFGVYYCFLKLYTRISDTVTSLCIGFHSERAAAGLGPSGLICAIADRDCTDPVCTES